MFDRLQGKVGKIAEYFVSLHCILIGLLLASCAYSAEPVSLPEVRQLVVTVTDSWDATRGRMQLFQRGRKSESWQPVLGAEVPVLIGRNGSAWGRGALPLPAKATAERQKQEGDGRAPAGVFAIGKIFGYASELERGKGYPYRQVTQWDAWSDDPKSPYYNRHMVVDPSKGIPAWFEAAKMRHGDDAYTWLLEVRHNADPPKPGAGSAIFFHTRRGVDRKTSGCTTMAREDLLTLLRWLDPKANPHYALLPFSAYQQLRGGWDLP